MPPPDRDKGVPADRLGIIYPWMGCDYTCAAGAEQGHAYDGCPVVARKPPAKDHVVTSFGDVLAHYLPNKTGDVVLNQTVQTKHFNYRDGDNLTHQVWFDDHETLAVKYAAALKAGVSALGMWLADYACAGYDSFPVGSPHRESCYDPAAAAQMWAALPATLKTDDSGSTAAPAARRVLRFLDNRLFHNVSNDIELRANKPEKLGVVIDATKPWEQWSSYALSVLQIGKEYLLYYKCAAVPNTIGGAEAAAQLKRVWNNCNDSQRVPANLSQFPDSLCVAHSTDGITWERRNLGIVTWNGSTDNNIIWPTDRGDYANCIGSECPSYEGSAPWVDNHPATPASERYKIFAADKMLSSPDGIHFRATRKVDWVTHVPSPDCHGPQNWDAEHGVWVSYCQLPCFDSKGFFCEYNRSTPTPAPGGLRCRAAFKKDFPHAPFIYL